jgi:hypothetical protein
LCWSASFVETTEAAFAVPNGVVTIEVAAYEDLFALAGPTAWLLVDLHADVIEDDGVVVADHTFLFDTQDVV